MRRKYLFKRVLILFTSMSLVFSSLSGCKSSNTENTSQSIATQVSEPEETKKPSDENEVKVNDNTVNAQLANTSAGESFEGNELIASIKSNFASATQEQTYNKGVYRLPIDYVFEFPCSNDAGYRGFDAFAVYTVPNFNETSIDISDYDYDNDNGVIRIMPGSVPVLGEDGAKSERNGTWGSMNNLYLVQYIDLETGEALDKPIVTPFSVEHEMKAPVVAQSVDEYNSYRLTWKPVKGAVKYVVYDCYLTNGYKVCCTTSDTTVSVNDFPAEKESDAFMDLFSEDLKKAGYDVDTSGVSFMNSTVHYSDALDDGHFAVIAIGEDGKVSGISNIVDIRELASRLPYTILKSVNESTISTVEDMPAYVDVEMLDGSVSQMIIDYHGAQSYRYENDPNKLMCKAHVANTLFNSFMVVVHGMDYQEIVDNISVVLDREDKLLATVESAETDGTSMEITEEVPEDWDSYFTSEPDEPGVEPTEEPYAEPTEEPTVEPYAEPTEEPYAEPTEEPTEEPYAEPTEEPYAEPTEEPTAEPYVEPTEEPTEEPYVEPTEEPYVEPTKTPVDNSAKSKGEQLMDEISVKVANNINILGADRVKNVLFAENDMEAWIAYCLIAQSDVIPLPSNVFPEAANLEYVFKVFLEAYRQNPTSGIIDIGNVQYNDEYEALIVSYGEDCNTRLNKTIEELNKAEQVVAAEVNSSMSDYEKVFALNEYFRINASYDFDSTSTSVDMNNLSEAFIDAHTPYGILCSNYGVCESYSEAFILTARMAGLEAVAEIGTLYGGGHEWNRVKVDGQWCVLDITNNDNNEIFVNGLFNLSDEQISGILVPGNQAVVNPSAYAATTDTKEFYYVNGISATSLSSGKQMAEDILKSSDKAVIRLPLGTTENEARDLMQEIYNDGVGISKGQFSLGLLYVTK